MSTATYPPNPHQQPSVVPPANSTTPSASNAAPTTTATVAQPMMIPGRSTDAITESSQLPVHSTPLSPSRASYCKKTGTRSTFCSNSYGSSKLTEKDYQETEEKVEPHRPPGILEMLGLRKGANYESDQLEKDDEPVQHSYY